MTQEELAEKLHVSGKAVSKWETGRGFPDVSLLEALADALGLSVIELLSGADVKNGNPAADMRRGKFWVCPVCGNVIFSVGEAVISCCGITLPPQEAEAADGGHMIRAEIADGEYYVSLEHPMSREHHISFLAAVSDAGVQLVKLYPEGGAEARFRIDGAARLYAFCNRHGLFETKPPRR